MRSDRAFAQRLCREVTVWKKYLDHVIDIYSSRPVEKLDQDVVRSLRIGAAQLLILKTPAHAAVSATVEAHQKHRSRGFVNAVLRKLASHRDKKDLPLHIRYSHPEKLTERWIRLFGAESTEQLLQWNNSVPDLGGYAFREHPAGSSPGRYLSNYRILKRDGSVEPERGFYIQDEAAAIAGEGMAKLPGETVLEIGAAPGGKTAHLDRNGMVFAIDLKPDRLVRWNENRVRLRWKNSMAAAADSGRLPFACRFDKVIVDAPCTNTGVYRRRADARWKWSQELLDELIAIQREMLAAASCAVKPGGVLVYSTCSIDTEENQENLRYFHGNQSAFEKIPFPAPKELTDTDGNLSFFPPESGIDGIFAAAWKKVKE